VCGGLQNSVDLGETVPSVCNETCLTLSADGIEVNNMRVEEGLTNTGGGGSFGSSNTSS